MLFGLQYLMRLNLNSSSTIFTLDKLFNLSSSHFICFFKKGITGMYVIFT